ncbi:hypothetical protein [Lewinella sp. IMCC34191]|uniref:hypothetical protein n=1 Tax=Lewinella sp. IMCC34191 TaxID=2259172 RepID=UPI000E248789|nr:hypothetical protein [Lewinella sp. IMCC34191]
MTLKDAKTGQHLAAVIAKLVDSDFAQIRRTRDYIFKWEDEKQYEVLKIFLKNENDKILGLMSLIDRQDEYRIHLNLIEVAQTNVGRQKKINNIAGCLIATACKISFDRGYNGFVSLKPKTRLIPLYQDKYGFRQYGRFLAIEGRDSDLLIRNYLYDEDE